MNGSGVELSKIATAAAVNGAKLLGTGEKKRSKYEVEGSAGDRTCG